MRTRFRGLRAVATALAAAGLLASVAAAPAGAITNGTLDGDNHPYVGLMTAHAATGEYLWRCSGTLISPKVFITAGHCTEPDDSQGFGPPTYAVVFFSNQLIVPDPDFTLTTRSCDGIAGYPCAGANETAVTGQLFLHPDFGTPFYVHDLGVVLLDGAGYNPGSFGQLPELNQLDALRPGPGTRFDAVGFGLQRAFPDAASWKDVSERIRMISHPWLIQINNGIVGDWSLLLSNNPKSGGTCFGDSGGPNFLAGTNTIAAVTSFGFSWYCGGGGGVYRLDKADDLNWLESTFGAYY
jgi:hypothetical protein